MKYNYKHLQQDKNENDKDFLERLNKLAEDGYRFIGETYSDDGVGRTLLEKKYD